MGQIKESVIDLLSEIEESRETDSDKSIITEDENTELILRKYPKKIHDIPKTIHFKESQRSINHSSI